MHEDGRKILNLMFRPGENVCVSESKYGFHSVPFETVFQYPVKLLPPPNEEKGETLEDAVKKMIYAKSEDLTLVALNPITGWRRDEYCTKYRNFLVEMDGYTADKQLEYIKSYGMPYSAAIWSGNKSIHFLISLDEDLPRESLWRLFAEWTLNVVTLADPMTKNPSRSIRIPGAFREPGKQQKLLEYRGPVSLKKELYPWLMQYESAKPKVKAKRVIKPGEVDLSKVKGWVVLALNEGLDPRKGRNRQWFAIAYEFALAGYDEDVTIDTLGMYFQPDRDFKEREWMTAIKSAFKTVRDKNG